MTTEEKAAAFDELTGVLLHWWSSGYWAWWVPNPAGGKKCATREEALSDLMEWVVRAKKWKAPPPANLPLPVIEESKGTTDAQV